MPSFAAHGVEAARGGSSLAGFGSSAAAAEPAAAGLGAAAGAAGGLPLAGSLGTARNPLYMMQAEPTFWSQLWRTVRMLGLAFLFMAGLGAMVEERGLSRGILNNPDMRCAHAGGRGDLLLATELAVAPGGRGAGGAPLLLLLLPPMPLPPPAHASAGRRRTRRPNLQM